MATTPPKDWPNVLVPLPVKWSFDPTGALYFNVIERGMMSVVEHPRHHVGMARQAFMPSVPRINTSKIATARTPEVIVSLPEWEEIEADVRRWLT